jgi:hypothetical protein
VKRIDSTRIRIQISRIRADHTTPQLWIAFPTPPSLNFKQVPGCGRRDITMPEGTIVTATWQEAMDYATAGRSPRPIADVYPEFCGMPA